MNGRLELREATGGSKWTLEGYASRTETPYEVLGFTETIRRGAFKRSLKEGPDTSLLVNHEGLPIARTTAGTLALSEDENGLHVRAELEPEDPDVQAVAWKMKSGALSEMSMGFRATKQQWNEDRTRRVIHEVALHRGDVSIVSAAASPTSTATLRAVKTTLEQRNRLIERIGDRVCGPAGGFTFGERASDYEIAARGHSTIAVPASYRRPSVTRRSHIEIAKAYAAKGEQPRERRSDTSPFGPEWVLKTSSDVEKAVRQVELGRAGDREGPIKAYIVKRAGELGCPDLIPTTNWSAARSRLEIARARAVKGRRGHPGSDASVEGEEDAPRYTQGQIDKLGSEGKAFKKRNGTYGWPIADRRDLLNAIKAWGRATPSEASAVKLFIKRRAVILGLDDLLPASWLPRTPVGEAA